MATPYQKVNPLDWRTPIVDPETGTPTDQFIRIWQQLFQNSEYTNGNVNDKANKTTQITAGNGLVGGGDLSADRVIAVGPGTGIAVGADDVHLTDTGVTPGTYGDATHVAQVTVDAQGRITAISLVAIAGGGGGTTPIVRGSNIQSSSASSYNVSFPAGTAAGDTAFIFTAGGWVPSAPAGWTTLDSQTGANVNGAVYYKSLVSGDLPGPVVVNYSNTYNSTTAILVIQGACSVNQNSFERSAANVSSDTLALVSSVLSTDLIVSFTHCRGVSTNTTAFGSILQQVAATEASGVLTDGTVTAGAFTQTFNYGSGSQSGYYEVVLALR